MESVTNVYENLHTLGLKLPQPPAKGGVYAQVKFFGNNLVYVSGCGPSLEGAVIQGKLGREFNLEQGQLYARNCMLNVLAVLQGAIEVARAERRGGRLRRYYRLTGPGADELRRETELQGRLVEATRKSLEARSPAAVKPLEAL